MKKSQMIVRATRMSLVVTSCVGLSTLMFVTPIRCQDKEDVQPLVSDVRKINDAGIQFEVPKGWMAETDKHGRIVLSIESGIVNITFAVEAKYEELIAGMKSGLIADNTDFATDGGPIQDDHNGMKHIRESVYVIRKGRRVMWMIDVYESRKNVTVLTFGSPTIFQKHIDEYERFFKSIKRI